MPTSSDNLYCVLTFKHIERQIVDNNVDLRKLTLSFLETMFPLKAYLVVLENGKTGTNQHLNVVLKMHKPRRTDHVRQSIYTHIYKKIIDDYKVTKNDVKVKGITNENMLIGGYLQKEDSFEVLLNSGYDLDRYREECKVIPARSKLKSYFTLTPHNAVEQIITYADENEMSIVTAKEIVKCVMDMSKNYYNIVPIISQLNRIGKVIAGIKGQEVMLEKYLLDTMKSQDSRETTQVI